MALRTQLPILPPLKKEVSRDFQAPKKKSYICNTLKRKYPDISDTIKKKYLEILEAIKRKVIFVMP